MARIRTIKPEFWTSEQIMECSPMARLLFIGLWNFCDDRGVHPVAYKTLKAEVFPADDILASDVERLVTELVSNELLGHRMASSAHQSPIEVPLPGAAALRAATLRRRTWR